jgi:hypothetical protein
MFPLQSIHYGPFWTPATIYLQLNQQLSEIQAMGSIPIARSSYPFPSNNLPICRAAKGGNKK